ncbi:hypothetical protein GYMLUDRAFT_252792 [Collybiopsis luxurians FD-317 M1]|uniref:Uncharacterized protein n=1 Tax=Collybiopsis luxurians FD-317 M1 TaxID=944289 RepID=A0A0D0B8Y8_9AGAR|nr:hypothetical protein GYMLUDRAFT_252792 [Collybiopsis luxurians FD-317 M1]
MSSSPLSHPSETPRCSPCHNPHYAPYQPSPTNDRLSPAPTPPIRRTYLQRSKLPRMRTLTIPTPTAGSDDAGDVHAEGLKGDICMSASPGSDDKVLVPDTPVNTNHATLADLEIALKRAQETNSKLSLLVTVRTPHPVIAVRHSTEAIAKSNSENIPDPTTYSWQPFCPVPRPIPCPVPRPVPRPQSSRVNRVLPINDTC